MPVIFHNPVAECEVPVQPYTLTVRLEGQATLGLVVNKIVDCDRFMEHIGNAIAEVRTQLVLNFYNTGKITFADEDLIRKVAGECDAAICAIGHCGSCTAGTVKDGIALVEQGCPAVSLVTGIFWDQAEALARSLGWPDAPRVKLPYPIWGVDSASMQSVATDIVPSILSRLESPDAIAA